MCLALFWELYVVTSLSPGIQFQADSKSHSKENSSPFIRSLAMKIKWGHHQAFSECAVNLICCCLHCDPPGSGTQNQDWPLCTRTPDPVLGDSLATGRVLSLPAVGGRDFQASSCILQGPSTAILGDCRAEVPGKEIGFLLPRWCELSLLWLDPWESSVAVFNRMATVWMTCQLSRSIACFDVV